MSVAEDTLREYIAFEFSPDVVDELITAIRILERTLYQGPTMSADAVCAFEEIMQLSRSEGAYQWLRPPTVE